MGGTRDRIAQHIGIRDYDGKINGACNCRINERAIKKSGSLDRNDHLAETRPLGFMDCDSVRQCEIIKGKCGKLVFYSIKIDHDRCALDRRNTSEGSVAKVALVIVPEKHHRLSLGELPSWMPHFSDG
jgi:hypothetical protein